MNSAIPSALEGFRHDVVALLTSKSGVFQGVPIIAGRTGDAMTKINEAFASAGVFGEVSIHRAMAEYGQTQRVILNAVDFVIDFYENVELNASTGTRKGAWGLAENALEYLNVRALPGYQAVITAAAGGYVLEDVSKDPDNGVLIVRVRLTTQLALPAPPL